MSEQFVDLVENDTQPQVTPTYTNVDVSAYTALELHIAYKPNKLVITGLVENLDHTTFYFPVNPRVTGVLTADAAVGVTSLSVQVTGSGQNFASLPASGEIKVGSEYLLYSSKSGSGSTGTLTLSTATTAAHSSGDSFEKLPDYRAGNWEAQVLTIAANGARLTFDGFKLRIRDDIE